MNLLGWFHWRCSPQADRLPGVEQEVAGIGPTSSTANDDALKAHVQETERLLEVQRAHIRAIQIRGGRRA